MALRQIRIYGDPILTKSCRPITLMTPRTKILIHDMLDTMYDADGVGLAAPQVGVLKRVAVVDIGDGPLVMVNPEIVETSGEQTGQEGCLSLPGQAGNVTRPSHIKLKAMDENMQEYTVEADELKARAICHECDHLDGIMYVEKVEGELYEVTNEEETGEEDREENKNEDKEENREGAEEKKENNEEEKEEKQEIRQGTKQEIKREEEESGE